MHSAPLQDAGPDTLLAAAAKAFPETLTPKGRNPREGGLVHRLDYETRGLILLARTQEALDFFFTEQAAGRFIKEYEAVSAGPDAALPGFPPFPAIPAAGGFVIESAFRPYGKGRKAVRPLLPAPAGGGAPARYRTEVLSRETRGGNVEVFRVRLVRGFRHQIRCHLAWAGRPLLGDTLYGGVPASGGIGLCAAGLFFRDPETGAHREFRLSPGASFADTIL